MENKFLNWMLENPTSKRNSYLKRSTAECYAKTIISISNHMIGRGVINRDLYNYVNIQDIKSDLERIYKDQEFKAKNIINNKRYTNALEQYEKFLGC